MKALASKIVQALEERPRQFSELVDLHREVPWREFLKAWGEVRAAQILKRDEDGQYLI
ncbi:MAG TPA: hypothetical protein VM755_04920 [Stellaceae bacterium]|nr:hypothetical protein [Stellaceae bacterium]